MEKNIVVAELKNAAEKLGITPVLDAFAPNVRVRLPMSKNMWDLSVEEIPFSVRSRNGIMRSGARTVGDVAEIIMSEHGLSGVRNLGKKSVSEIKTAILELAYGKLTEREKNEFWLYVIENNTDKGRKAV